MNAPAAPAPPGNFRPAQLPHFPVRATYVVLGAIGLVFLGQLLIAPQAGDFDPFIEYGAKVNDLIAQGQLWRLVTPIFVHGSLLHFAFNAYALYQLGRQIEMFYGGLRFTLLFFFAGVGGSTASLWLSQAPSIGASGAIFGLIGAQAVLFYRNRAILGGRARAGLQNILIIAAVNLYLGFLNANSIDNWAHLGGLISGLALAWVIGPVWGLDETTAVYASLGGGPLQLIDHQPLTLQRWGLVLVLSAGLAGFIGLAIGLRR